MIPARFFDGEYAIERDVQVEMSTAALEFAGTQTKLRWWPLAGLTAAAPRRPGMPLRVRHDSEPAARLTIADEDFLAELIARAPQLRGEFNHRRLVRTMAAVALGLVAAAGLLYGLLTLAPEKLAAHMPDSWRDRLGAQVEKSFVEDARACTSPAGVAALRHLENRLKEGNDDLPAFEIAAYDMPIVNAWSLPGGRIIVTGQLIGHAAAPDEVAAVIAHEIGHVAHRHPEAQLIRAAGLQVLLALFTGGSGNDTLGGLAGTLTVLRYSRGAEREADQFAVETLTRAQIDPLGLKRFFEAMQKEEGENPGGILGQFTSILATHPLTDERIAAIEPLPPGVVAREVLPDAEWRQLKTICSSP